MNERCKRCPLLCKRLDSDDDPARYSFQCLNPQQVITLVESSIKRFASWHGLQIKQSERSLGDQLAVLLSVGYRREISKDQVLLIAQAATAAETRTDLWFRYGLPETLCNERGAGELSSMIVEVLDNIGQCEWLLSEAHTR